MAETDFSLVDVRGRKYLATEEHACLLDAVREDPSPLGLFRIPYDS